MKAVDIAPYARPTLVAPELKELVGGFPAETWLLPNQPWLVNGVEKALREATTPLDVAVAVGRFARLAAPSPGASAWRRMQWGEKTIEAACSEWCSRALSEEARKWVEAAALSATDRLFDDVDSFFEEAVEADQPVYLFDLLDFAMRRDDLESVAWVLERHAWELRSSLQRLDARITSSCADTIEDRGLQTGFLKLQASHLDHLSTVAWTAPHAWWALPSLLPLFPVPSPQQPHRLTVE